MKTFLTLSLTFFMAYVGLMVGAAKAIPRPVCPRRIFSDNYSRDYKVWIRPVIIDGHCRCRETVFLVRNDRHPTVHSQELQQVAILLIRQSDARQSRLVCSIACRTTTRSIFKSSRRIFRQCAKSTETYRARQTVDAVIVTNDFNLNQVASLRGVNVLNINELATHVSPSCTGRGYARLLLKEGKEYNRALHILMMERW